MKKTFFIFIIFILLTSTTGAQTPVIDAINPVSGSIGTIVTITGSGFAPSGNTIIFQNAMTDFIWEVHFTADSVDGRSLTFAVPAYMNPWCFYSPGTPCPAPSIPITNGIYFVYVKIADVESNFKTFTVEGIPVPTSTPTKTPTITTANMGGDVNSDSRINIIDALMIAQYAVGNIPEGFNPLVADVDKNGKIDIVDALIVAQYYVGVLPGLS